MRLILNFIFFILSCVFIGCASPQHQALRRVDVGMDKADVLDLVGNPTRTDRAYNQDRWTYESYKNTSSTSGDENSTTYVFFADGKVTYVGPDEMHGAPQQSKGSFKKISEHEESSNSK